MHLGDWDGPSQLATIYDLSTRGLWCMTAPNTHINIILTDTYQDAEV